jgi:hypothetical protein
MLLWGWRLEGKHMANKTANGTRGVSTSPGRGTQIAEQPPRRGSEHERLSVFIGKWNAEGQNKEGAPVSPGARVTASETYEWLPGEFFVVARGEMFFGNDALKSIAVIGYDALSQQYVMHQFDSMGYSRVYRGGVRDTTWKFTGEHERAAFTMGDNGNTMTIRWDRTDDGSNWLPLCELNATRAR